MNAKKYTLKGDAKSQAKDIHNKISQMDGIKAIRVDSFANTVTVDYDENKVSSSQIESTLKENNYI